MTVLYIVRHGETVWNREGRIQGHTDVPLNELGRQQARELRGKLNGIGFHAAYTSDLSRARETAEIILAGGLPVISWPELRENNCGRWEGQRAADIAARDPAGWRAWTTRDFVDPPHGGESVAQLRVRVVTAMQRIVADHPDDTVLVVSHGGTMRAALTTWLGLREGPGPIANCEAFVVEAAGPEKRLLGRV